MAHAQSPVRDTDSGQFYDLQSLVHTNDLRHQPTAEAQDENEHAPAAQSVRHEQSDAIMTELASPGDAVDVQAPSADANVAVDNASAEVQFPPAPKKSRARRQKMIVEDTAKQSQDQPHGLNQHQPMPATSPRSGCRTCRMTGSPCRLYKRVQWCSSSDPPFDAWVTTVFPAKYAAARERAQRKTAGRGKPKGRPRKPKDL